MTQKIETVARNMRLTDNIRDYVEKKAAKLERFLQEIDEIRVELSHIKSARSALDRQVAQITVHGKGFILRSEERADDIHAAFDAALEKFSARLIVIKASTIMDVVMDVLQRRCSRRNCLSMRQVNCCL